MWLDNHLRCVISATSLKMLSICIRRSVPVRVSSDNHSGPSARPLLCIEIEIRIAGIESTIETVKVIYHNHPSASTAIFKAEVCRFRNLKRFIYFYGYLVWLFLYILVQCNLTVHSFLYITLKILFKRHKNSHSACKQSLLFMVNLKISSTKSIEKLLVEKSSDRLFLVQIPAKSLCFLKYPSLS